MSAELTIQYDSGSTIYATIRRRSDTFVWNGSAFVAWDDLDITDYDVALTDNDGGYYSADFPTTITAGIYDVLYFAQASTDPAIGDTAVAPPEEIRWNGTTTTPSSNIEGFHTERIFRIWVEDHLPLQVVPEADISEMILCNGGTAESGVPRFISFDEFGTGTLYPTPDDAYTIKMTWWPPLVSFTPGDTSSDTANIVVNLPGDLAEAVVRSRGVVDLQRNQPEQLKEGVIQTLMAEYNQLVIANRGSGNLGSRSIRRKSIDQIRAERRW